MTRHIILVLGLLLSLDCALRAQARLGFETGPTFPRLLNVLEGYNGPGQLSSLNSQSVTRFSGGVFADLPVGPLQLVTVRPEIQYLGAGGEIAPITGNNGAVLLPDTKYTLDYFSLSVPILFTPTFPVGKPWIGGGLYSSILTNGKVTQPGASKTLLIGNNSNDNVKRFDFGFDLTAGLALNWGLLLGVQFQQGFATLKPTPATGNTQLNTHNSIWSIHLGYEWKVN